jgi:hypothetical protein
MLFEWPMCKYPFGSGGNRVTIDLYLPSAVKTLGKARSAAGLSGNPRTAGKTAGQKKQKSREQECRRGDCGDDRGPVHAENVTKPPADL